MSVYERLEGVVDAVELAALAVRPRRDMATTRRGAARRAVRSRGWPWGSGRPWRERSLDGRVVGV